LGTQSWSNGKVGINGISKICHQLASRRAGEAKRRKLYDEYYAARTADFSQITAPLLSAANWGGMGLHTRGNFEGYLAAGSEQKWLEAHGDTHFTHFYSKYGEALQRRFFGYFLKGEDTQRFLQLKPVLSGQLQVSDQACRLCDHSRLEETFRRCEGGGCVAKRFDKLAHAVAGQFVIINDRDQWSFKHPWSPARNVSQLTLQNHNSYLQKLA
jgi:hypothetical protein